MRSSPKAWGPAADAPTFLPADALCVEGVSISAARTAKRAKRSAAPVVSRSQSESIITSAPKATPVPQRTPAPAPKAAAAKAAVVAEPVVSRHPSQSTVKPLPAPPEPSARGSRPSSPAPAAEPAARASTPSSPALQAAPPFVQFEGGASFDPIAIPLPPELATPIYDWLRRLALQADLAAADKLLRDAFADLTSSLSCLLIYSGPDGLHTLGANDEMPKDQSPIVAVARSRRALCTTHVAYLPIATTTETIAVVVLTRNSRQPAFNMIDQVTMAGLARESASIMHHLVVQHLQRRDEAEADKKSLYRPEALESHRRRGQEGVVTELSPAWVRRTYWVLGAVILAGIAFASCVQVPTYSSGSGVVVFDGEKITAPAPGTVDKVFVASGQEVHKGTLLLRLKADKEEADLRQANTELQAALNQYLFDNADETIRKSLITAQAQQKRAEDAVNQRSIYASADGTVSDIRSREGMPVEFGAPILTIIAPGTLPEVWAYMPASDLPRYREGMLLQVSLPGFEKTPEKVKITSIGRAGIAGGEAKRAIGAELADALRLAPETSYVIVKATLPAKFRAKGSTYRYRGGMTARTEIKVESKRFIVTLLPSLEKYVP